MVNGTYSIMLKTPMGVKKGEMVMIENAGSLSGELNVQGKKNPFEGGVVEGNNFSFGGTLLSSVGKMDYVCTGRVDGDKLEAKAEAKRGTLTITGTRKN